MKFLVDFEDLTGDVQQAILSVMDYAGDDRERGDYSDNYPGIKGSHVFESAVAIRNWIDGTNLTPEEVAGINPDEYNDKED